MSVLYGLRLHGFGLEASGLSRARSFLISADSMALEHVCLPRGGVAAVPKSEQARYIGSSVHLCLADEVDRTGKPFRIRPIKVVRGNLVLLYLVSHAILLS